MPAIRASDATSKLTDPHPCPIPSGGIVKREYVSDDILAGSGYSSVVQPASRKRHSLHLHRSRGGDDWPDPRASREANHHSIGSQPHWTRRDYRMRGL